MNKTEYLKELRKQLKRLPEQEINDALEYYTEYLEEAGPENEATVIEELGSPKELARKIIIEAVDKEFNGEDSYSEESSEGSKKEKSHNSIWIILLAILALAMSPVVLVLFIAFLIVILAIVITLIAIIASFALVAIAGVLVSIMGIIAIFMNPGIGFITTGLGLIMIPLGIVFTALLVKLTKVIFKGIRNMGGNFVHKKVGKKS